MRVKIAGFVPHSVVDGPGICFVVFFQGCLHHCPGCHNPDTHDFNAGQWYTVEEIVDIIKQSKVKNVTFSGGDPMYQAKGAYELFFQLKQLGYTVNMYTGFTYEEICSSSDEDAKSLANSVDLLIDGRFDISKKTLDIPFVGSSNQRKLTQRDRVKLLHKFADFNSKL